jgi:cytochrome c-type biogenesis protein CcmF
VAVLATVAFAVLELAFATSDFSFVTVAGHSGLTTPFLYRLGAAWSSQEGSLLLWLWLLSIWASLAIRLTHRRLADLAPYAQSVLLGFAAFFAGLLVLLASPFERALPAPLDGAGLNPLLRHPSMMIHPPLLYSGYTLFTVPFAFAVAALITGRLDVRWTRATRRFSLAAWLCLTLGIVLGARWSYVELGWGGYWAWDPVENASLMPWLTGTAFIHSVMVQERRGMLKGWNVGLVLGTGILALVGTFLVRSGILDSIHAFGASTLGVPFVAFIALCVLGSIGLMSWRWESLRSDHRLDSLLSREALFLVNNLALVALCFVIFWGTFFPLISEAVTGNKASVGPPWFDRYVAPLAILLVLAMAAGQHAGWRRTSPRRFLRALVPGAAAALAAGAAAVLVAGDAKPLAVAAVGASALVLGGVLSEYHAGMSARHRALGEPRIAALGHLLTRSRRRYAGYLVHAGFAIFLTGIAVSSAFGHDHDVSLLPGQQARVGSDVFRYQRATWSVLADPKGTGAILSLGAVLDVSRNGRHLATLHPARGYFPQLGTGGAVSQLIAGEPTSEVGLDSTLTHDIWSASQPDLSALRPILARADRIISPDRLDLSLIALAAVARHWTLHPTPTEFRLIDWPMVSWVWIGALIAIFGGLLALAPSPGRLVLATVRRSRAPAPPLAA